MEDLIDVYFEEQELDNIDLEYQCLVIQILEQKRDYKKAVENLKKFEVSIKDTHEELKAKQWKVKSCKQVLDEYTARLADYCVQKKKPSRINYRRIEEKQTLFGVFVTNLCSFCWYMQGFIPKFVVYQQFHVKNSHKCQVCSVYVKTSLISQVYILFLTVYSKFDMMSKIVPVFVF